MPPFGLPAISGIKSDPSPATAAPRRPQMALTEG